MKIEMKQKSKMITSLILAKTASSKVNKEMFKNSFIIKKSKETTNPIILQNCKLISLNSLLPNYKRPFTQANKRFNATSVIKANETAYNKHKHKGAFHTKPL